MKVYVVNLLCPDDEDTSQIVGVYTSLEKANAAIADNELDSLDTRIEEHTLS